MNALLSGWSETRLDDVLKFQPGYPFESRYFSTVPNGPRLVRNRDLRADDAIIYFAGPYSQDYVLSSGDILIGMDGDFAPRVWCEDGALLNQRVCRICTSPAANAIYLSYALVWPLKQLERATGATTVKHMSHRDIGAIVMPLPSRTEQDAIADALVGADDLVSALERLITKKQAIKHGILQQLLTGETRLPGFRGIWREIEIGALLSFKNGLNKGGDYFGTGTPIINFMDVMNGSTITAEDVIGRVTLTREEIKRFSVERGDLFFTRTSETIDEVGTAATLVDYIPDATFSGFILRGRAKGSDLDPRFLAQLFQLDAIRQQIMSSATYTTRALTNGRSLSQVLIRLPAVTEQRAIADVIADVDREITSLQKRTDKARAVKAGMMKELLTGRTRLPAIEVAG